MLVQMGQLHGLSLRTMAVTIDGHHWPTSHLSSQRYFKFMIIYQEFCQNYHFKPFLLISYLIIDKWVSI